RMARSRTRPEIVIDTRRDRFFLGFSDCVAPLVAKAARQVDIANDSAAQAFDPFAHGGVRAAVAAMLHNAIVGSGSPNQLASLPPAMRTGLLDIDVFAGLAGP